MVFQTTGGTNEEGLEVLRQLFRFAVEHQNVQLSVYCGRAWARLACNIQSSVSQCFLNRLRKTLTYLTPLSFPLCMFFVFAWTLCSCVASPTLFSCFHKLL